MGGRGESKVRRKKQWRREFDGGRLSRRLREFVGAACVALEISCVMVVWCVGICLSVDGCVLKAHCVARERDE